jgi:hypothetical protein
MMSPEPSHIRRSRTRVRRARLAVTVAVVVILGGLAAIADYGWHALFPHHLVADSCQVVGQTTGTVYLMDPDQLFNASTIADVAMLRGLPERAVVVALATAQQESKLRNLSYGDADSVGLFQQRPSQGWGAKAQLLIPTTATGKFYDALVKVHDWQTLPLATAAQDVQHSAFPAAYAEWEPRATALAAALTGSTAGQLSCRLARPGVSPTPPGSSASGSAGSSASGSADPAAALAAATSAITSALADDLAITSPSVAPAGAKQQTVTVSGLGAVADGDAGAAKHRTATVAAWAIAQASAHGVTRVVVGDQEWRADRPGWQSTSDGAAGGTVVLTIAAR